MSNLQDLVDNAMQSCIEGYAVSVVDSIEFELKRELSTEEHQQVYAAVDRAITGIDAAQKEINNLKIKLSDAGCLLVEWKQRVEKAEKERDALREVHIGEGSNTRAAADIYFQLVEELEVPAGGSLVGVIDNLKADLSAANEKLSKPVVLPAGYSVRAGHPINEGERNVMIPKEGGRWLSRFDVEHAIRVAGFTVEGE
ncbi:TPA: hypothetical protein ACLFOO_004597 [Yersinia enterocolitica]|uniref:hypothetical protein n=1 Tax=Yersinia enterocolitica TaxID=630 RepID=UPI002AC7A7B5|nr:hypothetical protein [Yersinia enterocolitica]